MRILFLLFVLTPIAEIWVLIKVGEQIGALTTVGIVLLTAVAGVALLRQQGVSTLLRARERLERAELPAREVLEGMLIAIGGALLLTPGFITDSFGFALLVPVVRRLLLGRLLPYINVHYPPGPHRHPRHPSGRHGKTLEGEYRRHD